MDVMDAHLETALSEFNDKVNQLEPQGISEELMEALVNRGCVLWMMEYRTSAIDDLDTASDILEELESSGYEADPGTFVRIHTALACILFDQDGNCCKEYDIAASRLKDLHPGCRHFDARTIVRTCIDACENLIDSEEPESITPYYEKGYSLTVGKEDAWSLNRRMELTNLLAESFVDLGDHQEAVEEYASAIDIGTGLLERGQLEDPEELVMSFVMKSESEQELGLADMRIHDLEAAITVLENMAEFKRLPDPEVLVSLHHDLADALMKAGRVGDAEKHLIRAMEVGLTNSGDGAVINTPGGKSSR